MIFPIFQQELQGFEDRNISLLEAKDTPALQLMSGESGIVCSYSSMNSYPSMETPNSNAT